MKLRHRLTICAALLICAALCASYTVRDLRAQPAVQPAAHAAAHTPAAAPSPERFALCGKNGYVAVIDPDCAAPVVTDIELAALREADRRLVEAGVSVSSREELLALLEDLGS